MDGYKRRAERLSVLVLVFSLLLRLAARGGWDVRLQRAVTGALSRPETASFLLYLELGQAIAPPETPEAAPPVPATEETEAMPEPEPGPAPPQEAEAPEGPEISQAAEALPEPEPEMEPEAGPAPPEPAPETQEALAEPHEALVFTEADAEALQLAGLCSYEVDKTALLLQPSVLDFRQDGPTVLIMHTHTCEAYRQEEGQTYEEDGTARTRDLNYSVARVGDELAKTLEARGISVIHDTSINDYPSFNGAYAAALERIEAQLAAHPTIQMVIDVHRDAVVDADGQPLDRTAVLEDGEAVAQLMLVVGTDEGGLYHPNWRDNLSWALKLQTVLERAHPGLCRPIDLRTERFDQHATAGSLLVEVGSSGNTLRQAIASARLLGEGLADLIEGT